MPLTAAAPRQHRHTRTIELAGYQRDDGLWDIEAHLIDVKAQLFHSRFRGDVPAGQPVHEMWMRISVDKELVIRAVEAVTDRSPFPECPQAGAAYQQLVGFQIGSGWTDRVRKLVGPGAGCTHLFELLRPLATVAIQTIGSLRGGSVNAAARRPGLIDSCHGWRADGEAVREIYPDWYRPGKPG